MTQVVRACFQRPDIQVVMPGAPASLIHALRAAAEVPAPLSETLPTFTRDRKDDYRIAHALLDAVDYLVTGDPNLLVLGQVENVRVVSPAGFLRDG